MARFWTYELLSRACAPVGLAAFALNPRGYIRREMCLVTLRNEINNDLIQTTYHFGNVLAKIVQKRCKLKEIDFMTQNCVQHHAKKEESEMQNELK